jgi:hypothetical protein
MTADAGIGFVFSLITVITVNLLKFGAAVPRPLYFTDKLGV